MTTEHDSTISLWSDYCDKKMEVERLHELETAARAEIERLREQVAEAQQDATRYRYWRERAYKDPNDLISPDTIDAVMDAALRNEVKP